ncbi:LptF/LptG family permease [Rurimicrobium arvi]|uniref:LptF/LptG family permease n=1 Tax=Rurimicrobium arvi TaxID=2049916 RepID=A0ABP8MSD0_9BACT
MIKKLDWYIIKKFWGTFVYALAVMALIASVIDYSDKVKSFVKHHAPFSAQLWYYENFIPHILALLFALFIFIATIFFTSKMAYKSEIVAFLASGASFNRFLRPYFIGGGVICGVFLVLNHWVVPRANRNRIEFEDRYVHEKVTYSDHDVHLRLSPELYIFLQNYDYSVNTGYRFSSERVKGTLLLEKLTAERISYDSAKNVYHLYNVVLRTNDGIKEKLQILPELTRPYPFHPSDLYENTDMAYALTTPELDRLIAQEKLRGRESLNLYYVEKHRRTAQPAAGFILCIIGACIASRKIRGGSGLHLAIGILISALYMLALQLSTTFSVKAGLDPLIAAWIPNFLFGIFAYILYRREVT